jgi:hypothetical protein
MRGASEGLVRAKITRCQRGLIGRSSDKNEESLQEVWGNMGFRRSGEKRRCEGAREGTVQARKELRGIIVWSGRKLGRKNEGRSKNASAGERLVNLWGEAWKERRNQERWAVH